MFRQKPQLREHLLSSDSLMFVLNPDHMQTLQNMFPLSSSKCISETLQNCSNDIHVAADILLRKAQEEEDRNLATQIQRQP
jgi:uncharacterized protein (UPF0276 family)